MDRSVLIADDEAVIRTILTIALERLGFQVFEAVGGQDALEQVNQNRPDVIILDHMMPDIDGLTVCRELRSHADTADLPVIMVSANTEPEDIEEGLRAGVTRYLSKPTSIDELLETINAVLGD